VSVFITFHFYLSNLKFLIDPSASVIKPSFSVLPKILPDFITYQATDTLSSPTAVLFPHLPPWIMAPTHLALCLSDFLYLDSKASAFAVNDTLCRGSESEASSALG
jgi:hypothetical protein